MGFAAPVLGMATVDMATEAAALVVVGEADCIPTVLEGRATMLHMRSGLVVQRGIVAAPGSRDAVV